MATSVVLRACGGLGPYTWSSTGAVSLSANEGTQVVVTPDGTGGDPTVAGVACAIIHYSWSYTVNQVCTGGHTYSINAFVSPSTCYACSGNTTACGSWARGTLVLTLTSTVAECSDFSSDLMNCQETGTLTTAGVGLQICNLCGGASCSPNLQHHGPKDGSNVNLRIQYTSPTAIQSIDQTVALNVTNSGTGNLATHADVRTASMISAGCPSCVCDPTGATVTVTDAVGTSVTYTF